MEEEDLRESGGGGEVMDFKVGSHESAKIFWWFFAKNSSLCCSF